MKVYQVGGSVRDEIRGVKPHDFDYCVVGSSISEMLSLGYTQVGKSFPVFLHPETGDEYALARKEEKTGNKHTDFAFVFDDKVTLEEDLIRRDFTINSIAKDMSTNEYIDPFNGIDDIKNKVLRITCKEHFAEDPLRILRAFRFKVLTGYNIEKETDAILRDMIASRELAYLSKERILDELTKGLKLNAGEYIELLYEYGALQYLLPEVAVLFDVPEKSKFHSTGNTWLHTKAALNTLAEMYDDVPVELIFGVLFHDIYKGVSQKHNYSRQKGDKYIRHDSFEAITYFNTIADRLGLPNNTKAICIKIIANHMRVWSGFGTGIKMGTWYKCLNSVSYKFSKDVSDKVDIILNACIADHISDHVGADPRDGIILKKLFKKSLEVCNSIKSTEIPDFDRVKDEEKGLLIQEARIKQLTTKIKPLFEKLMKGEKDELVKTL